MTRSPPFVDAQTHTHNEIHTFTTNITYTDFSRQNIFILINNNVISIAQYCRRPSFKVHIFFTQHLRLQSIRLSTYCQQKAVFSTCAVHPVRGHLPVTENHSSTTYIFMYGGPSRRTARRNQQCCPSAKYCETFKWDGATSSAPRKYCAYSITRKPKYIWVDIRQRHDVACCQHEDKGLKAFECVRDWQSVDCHNNVDRITTRMSNLDFQTKQYLFLF